jgi:uncharacterized protein YecE (DUF72 family)
MDFGKLHNIENLDFSLPPDTLETANLLRGLPQSEPLPHIYIGCTGWSVKEWIGRVYPKGTKANDYLHHYSRQFNTIEMNTTHYRIPSVNDVEKWYQQAPDDFRFAPKMLQTVSHAKNLGYGTGLTTQFCEALQGLREKLGVCFMQLPPHFSYKDIGLLELYLKKFPKHIPLAIELRHEEWFSNPHYFKMVFDLLENYKVSTVITDVAGRRDVLHQRLTTDTAVIRFVGNDLHETDFTRIQSWVSRLKIWCDMGLKNIYFFTHEPDNLKAPDLALFLLNEISTNFPAILRGPRFYDTPIKPVQGTLEF